MPLFDQVNRNETRPRRQNESSFDYMNSSARPGIAAIRDLLENWFEQWPDGAKADVSARLRSRDTVQHESAWLELFWHEVLRSSGYAVEIHPVVANVRTNPDFVARSNGTSNFYLEATLAMPPVDLAADRRLAELHDTLDRMNSPDYFIEVQYRGTPQDNIRGRIIREHLERWMQCLDLDEIRQLYAKQNYQALPTFTWPEHSLLLTFRPIPKSPELQGRPGARPIGIVAPLEMRIVRTHDDICAAIDGKATKYGDLQLPLVIAINVMDDFCGNADIWNALFGEEQIVAIRQPNGEWRDELRRDLNGAWHGRGGPRNTLVSAVVITHQLSPANLRTRAVELIHNPWAAHPLPAESITLVQHTINPADGRIHRVDGTNIATLLHIPDPWPIPNEQ